MGTAVKRQATEAAKSIELFAGAGGLGIGLAHAGFEPLMLVEQDRWCCQTLRDNGAVFENGASVPEIREGDIRKTSFRPFEGGVDLLSGGPPCQPFSLGGRHKADADARDMFPEAVRAVREAAPRAFVFENVKGLTRSTFFDYFYYIQLQLEHPELAPSGAEQWQDHLRRLQRHHTSTSRDGLHYNVVAHLMNAANYGVPQKRERVFFVGFRDDVDARWSPLPPSHSHEALVWDQVHGDYWDRHEVPKVERQLSKRGEQIAKVMSASQRPETLPWETTRDAIKDLPEPVRTQADISEEAHRYQPGAKIYPGHTGSLLDEPSKTLKAGVHGVPGGENMFRRADGSVRYFTVRESARLQTFPDDYKFHGAWSECMRQLGNAVPARLAAVVGTSVSQKLGISR